MFYNQNLKIQILTNVKTKFLLAYFSKNRHFSRIPEQLDESQKYASFEGV